MRLKCAASRAAAQSAPRCYGLRDSRRRPVQSAGLSRRWQCRGTPAAVLRAARQRAATGGGRERASVAGHGRARRRQPPVPRPSTRARHHANRLDWCSAPSVRHHLLQGWGHNPRYGPGFWNDRRRVQRHHAGLDEEDYHSASEETEPMHSWRWTERGSLTRRGCLRSHGLPRRCHLTPSSRDGRAPQPP